VVRVRGGLRFFELGASAERADFVELVSELQQLRFIDRGSQSAGVVEAISRGVAKLWMGQMGDRGRMGQMGHGGAG
jgi:hypothetical protein